MEELGENELSVQIRRVYVGFTLSSREGRLPLHVSGKSVTWCESEVDSSHPVGHDVCDCSKQAVERTRSRRR